MAQYIGYSKVGIVSALLLGGIVGSALTLLSGDILNEKSAPQVTGDVRDRIKDAAFVNPLLECAELPPSISIGERRQLEKNISAYIDAEKKVGTITEAAVYFRDLNNGPWFGINEDLQFSPASLAKVPLAMWYYARADSDPSVLEDEINFVGPRGVSIVHFQPSRWLEDGTTYTIEALIQLMLQESDNDAAHILHEYLGSSKTDSVYHDLGISIENSQGEYVVDVHTFASFFRILYNATYIGRFRSEHMLDTLSRSSFTYGLRAGVPSSIPVAHKFGEKKLDQGDGIYQLHDCGIVYAPVTPYVLCVMTQGDDLEKLADFIAHVSRVVYNEVE